MLVLDLSRKSTSRAWPLPASLFAPPCRGRLISCYDIACRGLGTERPSPIENPDLARSLGAVKLRRPRDHHRWAFRSRSSSRQCSLSRVRALSWRLRSPLESDRPRRESDGVPSSSRRRHPRPARSVRPPARNPPEGLADGSARAEGARRRSRGGSPTRRRIVSDVDVHLDRGPDSAGILLRAASDADLLVVGSRGHGRVATALVGSVSAVHPGSDVPGGDDPASDGDLVR